MPYHRGNEGCRGRAAKRSASMSVPAHLPPGNCGWGPAGWILTFGTVRSLHDITVSNARAKHCDAAECHDCMG